MFLDSKLDFDAHIKGVFDKTSKSIGLIRNLRNLLPRVSGFPTGVENMGEALHDGRGHESIHERARGL